MIKAASSIGFSCRSCLVMSTLREKTVEFDVACCLFEDNSAYVAALSGDVGDALSSFSFKLQ